MAFKTIEVSEMKLGRLPDCLIPLLVTILNFVTKQADFSIVHREFRI